MDHLPKVSEKNRSGFAGRIEVPCVIPESQPDYVPRGLEFFVQVQEKSLKDLQKGGINKRGARDASSSKSPDAGIFQSFLAKPRTWTDRRSPEDTDRLAFAQYMLWFGLLAETMALCGVSVDPRRLVRQGRHHDGGRVIDSSALTEYISYWHMRADALPPATKKDHMDYLVALFAVASGWLAAFRERLRFVDVPPHPREGYEHRFNLRPDHPSYPRVGIVLLSIRVLCETLHRAAKSAYADLVLDGADGHWTFTSPKHAIIDYNFMQSDFEFVDRLMVDAGWCPNEIAVMSHRFGVNQNALRFYLCTFNRRGQGHDHSRCNRHRCYKLMEYPYLPKHLQEGCECPYVYTTRDGDEGRAGAAAEAAPVNDGGRPVGGGNVVGEDDNPTATAESQAVDPETDVVQIVRRGHIPLLRLRQGAADTDSDLLEVSSYDPATVPDIDADPSPAQAQPPLVLYVAISHVWSDGLGNRAGNFLPACRLRQLQRSVNDAHLDDSDRDAATGARTENVRFWIDTLCIPRRHPAERRRAIATMADVYRNAAGGVLVLDRGLQRTELRADPVEAMEAIAQSGWARRLWTLQEARMARWLHFEVGAGSFSTTTREPFLRDIFALYLGGFGTQIDKRAAAAELGRWPGLGLGSGIGSNRREARTLLHLLGATGDVEAAAACAELGDPAPDSIADRPDLRRFSIKMGQYMLACPIFTHATNRVSAFLRSADPERALPVRFIDLCSELRMRRTTEPADEAITMATLLGGADYLGLVLATAPEKRMAALLRSLPALPAGIVFFQGERYAEEGARWIPRSFLLRNGRLGDLWGYPAPDDLAAREARPDPAGNGLLVRYPGVRFRLTPAAASRSSASASSSTRRCYFRLGAAKYVLTLTEGNRLRLGRTSWAEEYGGRELAVILKDPLEDVTLPACGGVLVSARQGIDTRAQGKGMGEGDGQDAPWHVRFEHTVLIHRAERELHTRLNSIVVEWPGESGGEEYVAAEALPESHSWCLG